MDSYLRCRRLTVVLVPLTALWGCMAAALAPAVSLVTGTMDNSVVVQVDEKTVTADIKAAFASARTLAVVAGDRSSVMAADVFETKGGYAVSIDRPTAKNGEMTGSERREALRRLCHTVRPDVALLGRVVKSDSGNTVVAAVTGRAKTSNDWAVEIMPCRSGNIAAITGTIAFDLGIHNVKPAELEERTGAEIGAKILAAVKGDAATRVGTTAPAAAVDAAPAANVHAAQTPAPRTALPAPQQPADANATTLTVVEAQRRLIELGFLTGKPDGVWGKRSTDALKKFQEVQRLAPTGRIDASTSKALGQPALQ